MPAESVSFEPPLVAILRGVTPERVVDVGKVLHAAGFRVIEVPLNSPQPFRSIEALAAAALPDLIVGAGTVLTADDATRTHQAGGRLVVAPNCNAEVIQRALGHAMRVMPGVATATEVFAAIDAGATQLKLFPAATYGPKHLRALGAVLPPAVGIYPVGGITAEDVPAWLAAGAAGFGFGSEVFKAEYSLDDIQKRATTLVRVLQSARKNN